MRASSGTSRPYSTARRSSSFRAFAIPAAKTPAFYPKNDVFQNGVISHQHEMLVNHSDSRRDRIKGPLDRNLLSAYFYGSGVGAMETIDDIHHRRLAGSVFAD